MRFKLPFPLVDQSISALIISEIKKQKLSIPRTSKEVLHQIAKIAEEIKRTGLPKYLVCKKLPRGMGRGIFLHPKAKPLLKGDVIAPYSGIVTVSPQNAPDDSAYIFELIGQFRLSKEEQAHFSKRIPYHPRRLYSVNLDALKRGNFTRFINHSDTPNVVAHQVQIPANPLGLPPCPLQIIYLAKKTIHPGEQLLVCYEAGEKSYWTSADFQPVPVNPKTFQIDDALHLISRKEPSSFRQREVKIT